MAKAKSKATINVVNVTWGVAKNLLEFCLATV